MTVLANNGRINQGTLFTQLEKLAAQHKICRPKPPLCGDIEEKIIPGPLTKLTGVSRAALTEAEHRAL